MKIVSFQIHHYGPLAETPRIFLKAFNLFWGHNEDGKTLTLEALVTLLLGKAVRRLDKTYARVEELPSGYVEVQLDDAATLRLEGKTSLSDHLKISPELFLNLFVVRNSDLLITEDQRFYGNVTEQLTHSRLSRIEQLRQLALEKAQLTPKGDQLRNTSDNHKLRDRYQQARALIETIRRLEEQARKEKWPEITRRMAEIRQRLETLEQDIIQLEAAHQREQLEQGERLLSELETVNRELQALHDITPEVSQEWQARETMITRLKEEIAELQRQIEKTDDILRQDRHELEILQAEIENQRSIRERLQVDFLPEEKHYDDLRETVTARQSWQTVLHVLIGATLFSTLMSLYFTLKNPQGRAFIFFLVSLFVFGTVLVTYILILVRPTRQLKRLAQRLINKALAIGLEGDTAETVRQRVHQFLHQLSVRENRFEMRRAQLTAEEKQLEEQRAHLQRKQEELFQHQQQLTRLKQKLDVATLIELNQRLKHRNQLEHRRAALEAQLNQLLNIDNPSPAAWKNALAALETYRNAAPGIQYDAQRLTHLRQEQLELGQELEQLNHVLQTVNQHLQDVERTARTILVDAEPPPLCQTVFDLPTVREQLEEFCRQVDHRKWLGQQLHAVLNDALEEEQARISDLFGENSRVSAYFREITGGLYTAVLYDVSNNQLKIQQRGGKELNPEQLSGGTLDQLYFAIRLALGEKILEGRPGFLLLDDPFIKADPQRFQILMEMLFTLVDRGWQILYFSAKEEVLAALEAALKAGRVHRVTLPTPLYKISESAN